MAAQKLFEEQRAEIARQYIAGRTMVDLAREYDVCTATIRQVCIRRNAKRPPQQRTHVNEIIEFTKRARSILWRQDFGKDKYVYDKWMERVKELESPDGAAYDHHHAVIRASKEFPCLYRLFREYDVGEYDPNPDSHPTIQHFGNASQTEEVLNQKIEQTHRENLNWAISAAGEFLRTGRQPAVCPNDAAWYLFIQARSEPKEFLSRFNQIESKSDGTEQCQSRKIGQRSVAELEAMLSELTNEEKECVDKALEEVSWGETGTEN